MNYQLRLYSKAGLAALVAGMLACSSTIQAQEAPKRVSTPAAPTTKTPARSPWERIVMIGASATAGFTVTEPLGGPETEKFRLSRYLDAALLAPHEPPRNLASTFFFLQPEADARRQIDEARQARPTLVVGLDFLFWFCYGAVESEGDRLNRFESGLKFLEELPGPLVVGDIPDASGATEMLAPEMVPSTATRAAANRRLKAWAATRKQITVVSLSDFMRAALANEAVTVHGRTVAAGKTRGLLQADKLHPSPRGCTVLALALIDALQASHPGPFAGDVRWDPADVLRLGSTPQAKATNAPAKPQPPAKSAGGGGSKP